MKKQVYLLIATIFTLQMTTAQQTVGLFQNDSLAYNGYTLFAPVLYGTTYLIDNCGNVVNTWESNYDAGQSVYLLENGNLLRCGRITGTFSGGGIGGRIEMFDWNGNLVWHYNYASNGYHHHHDIEPLPNGNILILAWESKSAAEAAELGRLGTSVVWPERIVEVTPIGYNDIEIVWQWHLWDHLIQDTDSTKVNFGVVADHPELVDVNAGTTTGGGSGDWIHANGIDYNADLDQILISSRHFSEIWIIDHSTTSAEAAGHTGGNSGKGGDLLYRWGNPQLYGRGTETDQQLWGQHHAEWIPEGYPNAGMISLFNNGWNQPGDDFSSINIIDPPMDIDGNYSLTTGEAYGPTAPFWTYSGIDGFSFYSGRISGTHALPNGNMLICDGRSAHFFEVDMDGAIHWDYQSPVSGSGPVNQGEIPGQVDVFRATKYPADYPAFADVDLMPMGPIEGNPLPNNCTIYGEEVVGLDNQAFIKREVVVNNPVFDKLHLTNNSGKRLSLQIYNVMGELVLEAILEKESFFKNVAHWQKGIYLAKVKIEGTQQQIQKIIKH